MPASFNAIAYQGSIEILDHDTYCRELWYSYLDDYYDRDRKVPLTIETTFDGNSTYVYRSLGRSYVDTTIRYKGFAALYWRLKEIARIFGVSIKIPINKNDAICTISGDPTAVVNAWYWINLAMRMWVSGLYPASKDARFVDWLVFHRDGTWHNAPPETMACADWVRSTSVYRLADAVWDNTDYDAEPTYECWQRVIAGERVPIETLLSNQGVMEHYLGSSYRYRFYEHDYSSDCDCNACTEWRDENICSECNELFEDCICDAEDEDTDVVSMDDDEDADTVHDIVVRSFMPSSPPALVDNTFYVGYNTQSQYDRLLEQMRTASLRLYGGPVTGRLQVNNDDLLFQQLPIEGVVGDGES